MNDGVATSVRSISSAFVKERMSLFNSILFSLPIDNDDGTLLHLVPTSFTNEVKEIFAKSSYTSEQARRIQKKCISLADDIGQEVSYLSRLNQFPRLSLTNILFMLQSHHHLGNMDSNIESLKNLFPS